MQLPPSECYLSMVRGEWPIYVDETAESAMIRIKALSKKGNGRRVLTWRVRIEVIEQMEMIHERTYLRAVEDKSPQNN